MLKAEKHAVKELLTTRKPATSGRVLPSCCGLWKNRIRQIAANAGIEGSIIVEKIRAKDSVSSAGAMRAKGEYVDMIEAGSLWIRRRSPVLICRMVSVSAMLLTTESLEDGYRSSRRLPNPAGMQGMY